MLFSCRTGRRPVEKARKRDAAAAATLHADAENELADGEDESDGPIGKPGAIGKREDAYAEENLENDEDVPGDAKDKRDNAVRIRRAYHIERRNVRAVFAPCNCTAVQL